MNAQLQTALVLVSFIVVLVGLFVFINWRNNQHQKQFNARTDIPEEFKTAILNKKVSIGMTEEMVRLAWGNPNRIENTTTEKGRVVRFRYGIFKLGSQRARGKVSEVHFTNGIVSKIKT